MTHWLLIRTEPKKEAKVYSWLIEKREIEAWLPRTVQFTRMHRKAKHMRQMWRPALEGHFFAKMTMYDLPLLYECFMETDCKCSVYRNSDTGVPFTASDGEIEKFQTMLDDENEKAFRNNRSQAPDAPKPKTGKPSKKLRRRPVAEHLAQWVAFRKQQLAKTQMEKAA